MSKNTSDWKSFSFRLDFDPNALKDELVRIEAYRLSLNQLILPQEWQADLQHLFIVRSVHGTTAIEGNPLTEDEVSQQLEATRTRRRDQVHRQTENALAAFRWVEKEFASPGRRVSFADILAIHGLLTTGSDQQDNHPGRIRESGHNVTVGSPDLGGVHRPPPGGPDLVKLVREYVKFINSSPFLEQNAVVQSLVAHFYLVTLHPFGDGNGRTTRCIEAAILHAWDYNTYGFYSLSNYFYRNRDDYFRLLQETRTRNRYDLTQFLLFGVRGFREELDRINVYVRNRTHRLQYRDLIRRAQERRVGKRRRLLNEREAFLLHRILDETKPADPFSSDPTYVLCGADVLRIARPLYARRTPRTVARELIRLKELGFLSIQFADEFEQWKFEISFEAIARY
ncbi:MAG: Fic family protein [Planctomycetota bacterium]